MIGSKRWVTRHEGRELILKQPTLWLFHIMQAVQRLSFTWYQYHRGILHDHRLDQPFFLLIPAAALVYMYCWEGFNSSTYSDF